MLTYAAWCLVVMMAKPPEVTEAPSLKAAVRAFEERFTASWGKHSDFKLISREPFRGRMLGTLLTFQLRPSPEGQVERVRAAVFCG